MTRAPSVKALTSQLKDCEPKTAKLIREVIKAKSYDWLIDFADKHCPRTWGEVRRFYNEPTIGHLRSMMLDELLGTFGVEYLFKGSEGLRCDPEGMHDSPILTYCNAGDTYATTLIRYRGRWQIGCWGDIAERYL